MTRAGEEVDRVGADTPQAVIGRVVDEAVVGKGLLTAAAPTQ